MDHCLAIDFTSPSKFSINKRFGITLKQSVIVIPCLFTPSIAYSWLKRNALAPRQQAVHALPMWILSQQLQRPYSKVLVIDYQWKHNTLCFFLSELLLYWKYQLAGPEEVGLDRYSFILISGKSLFQKSVSYTKLMQWTVLVYHMLRCWQREAASVWSKFAF